MKQHINVDLTLAQKAINLIESKSKNFSQMCSLVAAYYNINKSEQFPIITAAVINLRINRDKTLTTSLKAKVVKKRGKTAEEKLEAKLEPDREATLKAHEGREKWALAALAGKYKGAVYAKCWECAGRNREVIKNCTSNDCANFSVRPYK